VACRTAHESKLLRKVRGGHKLDTVGPIITPDNYCGDASPNINLLNGVRHV